MEVLSEAKNSVCYIYNTYFHGLEEIYESGAGTEPAMILHFLPCDLPYYMRCQNALENKSHDVLDPNNMDDFWDQS